MYLSIPATVSIASACINLVVAGLSAGIGWRAGWRDMRAFGLIALTGAAYNCCDIVNSLPAASELLVIWGSRVSVAVAGLHGSAWVLYMAAEEKRTLRGYERLIVVGVIAFSASSLVPGLVISSALGEHTVLWLGATYRDAVPTAFGGAVFAVCVAFLLFPLLHFVRRWQQHQPLAWAFVFGLSVLFVASANDALAGTAVIQTPYLIDVGFLGVVLAAGGSIVHRFATAARNLDALTGKLEQLVVERTQELTTTQRALASAEKLAALGSLAAGVAHEINNPTAAVLANLAYLREPVALCQPLPADARVCLDESITSVQRVARIVRQLLDAGRVAGGPQARVAPFALARAIRSAVANARSSQHKVEVVIEVDDKLHVLGDEDLLVQVVVNLVMNGAQAIAGCKAQGRVSLAAERRGDRVLLSVRDDGPGIAPNAQARLFEPFFTTKGPGRGTGLGLAVSLGLMRAQGGDLRVLATSPAGTTIGVELPYAEPQLTEVPPPPASVPVAALHRPADAPEPGG